MQRIVPLCMLIALCATEILAQKDTTWLRRWAGSGTSYQEDWARDIAVDDLGNVYVTGICNAGGTGGGYVTLKYSSNGKLRWERFYYGSTYNEAHAIAVDSAYNVWVTGESGASATRDIYTVAYDPDGNVAWQGRFDFNNGTDVGYAIDAFETGHVAVTGYGSQGGAPVLFHGEIGWSRQVPGMWGQAIDVMDSTVTVAGADGGTFGVIRYDLQGNFLWHSKSGGAVGGYSLAVASLVVDSSGNSYVTGTTGDLYSVSFDEIGNVRWSALYIGPRRDAGSGIALDSKCNVITIGSTDQSTGDYYAFHGLVMKHDSLGNTLWSKVLDFGGVNEQLSAMAIGRGDTIYVAGMRYASQSGDADYLIAKLSPNGDLVWWTTYTGNGASYSTASAIAVDTSGGLYVTGWSSQNNEWPDNADIVTIKFWGKNPFLPNPDGWQFANTEENMWPQDWWSQFHYDLPPYPLFFTQWPVKAKSFDFPDWPLFVEVFGEDKCYYPSTVPGSSIWKPSAIVSWRSIVESWGGSCFGFATSSLLFFNDFLSFEELYPSESTVFSVPLSSTTRRLVNRYYLYQSAGNLLPLFRPLYRKTPSQTARELITMITEEGRNNKSLSILNTGGSGGHEIVPCRIAEHPGDAQVVDVKIYDSNYPGREETLSIDTVLNAWWYPNLPGWGGGKWIMLGLDISTYASRPSLPKPRAEPAHARPVLGTDSTAMIVYVTPGTQCLITDASGAALGYDPSDSSLTATMEDAFPIIPRTGRSAPPMGYFVPANPHQVQLSSSADTSLYVRAVGKSLIATYEEYGVRSGEKLSLRIAGTGDTLAVMNPENRARTGMLRSIRVSPERELACDIADMTLPGNDSLAIAMTGEGFVGLQAGGSASTYTLSLTLAAPCTSLQFRHRGVALSGGSTHIITPDWERLDSAPVRVFVDRDGDGTPEDTLVLANEITEVGGHGALIPNEYRLEQNYPNPFNPITTIRYGLPEKSQVHLTVFNLLGQEVATLVQEEQEVGYHEVRFDGSGLASGVYIYRFQAGDFAQSRKLILLR